MTGREGKRARPGPVAAPTRATPRLPASNRRRAPPIAGNAAADLETELAEARRGSLPFRPELEDLFGAELGEIAVALDVETALASAGVRGAASDEVVAFVDPVPPFGLVVHEVVHVLQHRIAGGTGDPELEARAARAHAERGAPEQFVVRASAGAAIQFDPVDPPRPERPARLQSPVALEIATDNATAVPGTSRSRITLGGANEERATQTIEAQIKSAELVTAYAIPIEDTFPSAQAAADERERRKHALLPFQPPAPKPTAAAKPPAKPPAKLPPAKPPAPPAKPPPPPVPVVNTQSEPSTTADVVYDLEGAPIKLIKRAANWGITWEFNKLAVGAASCGALTSEGGGLVLLDAGVRHTGDTIDADMLELTIEKLHQIADRMGPGTPIENQLFTHSHLDHIGMFDRISREFVVRRITINTWQLRDPRLLDVLRTFGQRQMEARKRIITKRISEEKLKEWKESDAAKAEFAEGVGKREFEKFLATEADKALAEELKTKPLERLKIDVHVPAGTGGQTITANLPDIDITPHEVVPGHGSFVSQDAFGTTVLDMSFADQAGLKGEPETPSRVKDLLESNYFFKLENGNLLAIAPDMYLGDLQTNAVEIVKAVNTLGGNVTLFELAHHGQGGIWENVATRLPAPVKGVVMASELGNMSRTLTGIVKASKGGAFAMMSGEAIKIDPAVMTFLDLCGLTVMPTTANDVGFVSAVAASGEQVDGVTAGEVIKTEESGLLLKVDATLDKRLRELQEAEEELLRDIRETEATRRDDLVPLEEEAKLVNDEHSGNLKKEFTGKRARQGYLLREKARLKSLITEANARADKQLKESAALARRDAIREHYNKLMRAKEKLLQKLKDASQGRDATVKGDKPRTLDLKEFEAEIKEVKDLIDAEFAQRESGGPVKHVTETSLILLKKNVARTALNAELQDAWRDLMQFETTLDPDHPTLESQVELIRKLEVMRDVIKRRPDIADQVAVKAEVDRIEAQLHESGEWVKAESARVGSTKTEIDPVTQAKIENTVVTTETTEDAAKRENLVEVVDKPPEGGGAASTSAEPPKEGLWKKFDKGTRWTGDKVGRAMGGVMMFQNIKGGFQLIDSLVNGKDNFAHAATGLIRSAYSVNVGYRMLAGTHVGQGEFLLLSALEVTEALLGNYNSTAEHDTEVAYALISGGLNAALMVVGEALMAFGPVGMIAGFIVMAAGDKILSALGVKAWLAKMFDPRPNQMIDLDRALQKELEQYAITIGTVEIGKDPNLAAYNAAKPADVQKAAAEALADRRKNLLVQESRIATHFDDAYKRAQKGYMGLKWLDDKRAEFARLFLQVHATDPIAEGGTVVVDLGENKVDVLLTKRQLLARLQGTEALVSLANATEDDVRKMEQWSKLDKYMTELIDRLYHESYDSSNYDYVDWMKTWESVTMIEQMIANARYRLDPSQGDHRIEPLLSPGPAKQLYERKVLEYENKIDVLRKRVLDMSMGTGEASGIKEKGVGLYIGKDVWGLPAVYYDKGVYYEPEYPANPKTQPAEKDLLAQAGNIANTYWNFVMTRCEEVGLPEGVTALGLLTSTDVIRKYTAALGEDAGFKEHIFNLQATRTVTIGAIERAHRLVGRSATAKEGLAHADKEFKDAEEERIAIGQYLREELPALEQRVGLAHARVAATVLGEKPDAKQMSGMEHIAAADDALEKFHLSTIRDRVIRAGIVMPIKGDVPIERMFSPRGRPDVIVGIAPGTDPTMVNNGGWVEAYWVFALNDPALTYVGSKDTRMVYLYNLVPVTIDNLKGATPFSTVGLRPEPPRYYYTPQHRR